MRVSLRDLHSLDQLVKDMGLVDVTFLLGILLLAVQGGQEIFSSHKARAGLTNRRRGEPSPSIASLSL